jgi:molybdopterin-guanine dinucleotide biosynthesis protein A
MSDTEKKVSGVILAGGQSRRMFSAEDAATSPKDKGLLDLGGTTMLGHVIARLRPQVGAMALNANGDPARFSAYGLPVIADSIEGFAGPLAGVLAGLRWSAAAAPQARWIVTAAADTPFFPQDLVQRFLSAADGRKERIVLAKSDDGMQPVFGLWPTALADDLDKSLEQGIRKVLAWTDRHDSKTVHFPTLVVAGEPVDPFFNANRPEDLERARDLLKRMSS